MGLITNPVIALLALGSQAEHHLVYVDETGDTEAQAETGAVNEGEQPGVLRVISEDGDPASVRGTRERGLSSPRPPPQTTFRIRSASTTSNPAFDSRRDRGSVRRMSSTSLTANVSTLRPLPSLPTSHFEGPGSPGSRLTPSGFILAPLGSPIAGPYGSPPQRSKTATSETPVRRPRAMTASSGTGSFYLGGTGGRAQRPNRGRASTLMVSAVPPKESREGVQEVLVEQDATATRERSATTSNATPRREVVGEDQQWSDTNRRDPGGDIPATPTREGRRRGVVRMLTGSRESMR